MITALARLRGEGEDDNSLGRGGRVEDVNSLG